MCMVKPYYILAKRFGLFAVRLPSLSQGKWTVGLWHNFDIFTHGKARIIFVWFYYITVYKKKERKYMLTIWMMDIMLQPTMNIRSTSMYTKYLLSVKSTVK